MTKTKTLMALGAVAVLAGCSTPMTEGMVEAMNRPTVTLDCVSGCTASYTDPRDRMQLPTNGWDTANTAINAVSGAVTSTAPWAAIGLTAAQGIKSAVGDDNSDNSVRTDSSATDNSTRTDDRVTDNSLRLDTRDQSTDTTHEPTVVTQPEPKIVTTPGPEIVQQPAPTIVEQPAPTIVTTPGPEVVRPEIVPSPGPEIVRPEVIDPVIMPSPAPIIVRPDAAQQAPGE